MGRTAASSLNLTKSAEKRQSLAFEKRASQADLGTQDFKLTRARGKEIQRGTLGFCQFVEAIARIGLIGLAKPHFNILYPSALSKVAAVSIGAWGGQTNGN